MDEQAQEEFPGRLLHQACLHNNHELLGQLLIHIEKDNINVPDPVGRPAVYTAVSAHSAKCLILLLKNGAQPDVKFKKFNGMVSLLRMLMKRKEV